MATEIIFEVQDLEPLRDRMNRSDTFMRISLNEGLRKLGRLFVPAKGTGPLADATPKISGKLARSTFFQIGGGIGDQRLEILQPAQTDEGAFYGWFVREGTKAHLIVPRFKKALRFVISDIVIFAMHVHHPGNRPNPYHLRVVDQMMPEVQNIVNEMGQRLIGYLSGDQNIGGT